MSEESYSEYMFKGISVTFVASIVIGVAALATRMYLSRALSTEEYGILFAVISFFGFLRAFRELGLGQTIVKFIPEYRVDKKFTELKSSIVTSLLIQLAVSIPTACVFYFFSGWFASAYIGNEAASTVIQIFSFWFVLKVFASIGPKIFGGFRDIPRSKSVEIVRMFSILIPIVLVGYFSDLKIEMAAVFYVFGSLITFLWIVYQLRNYKDTFSKGELVVNRETAKKVLYFGLPLLLAGLAGSVSAQIDTMVITVFRTPQEVGLYQVARPGTRIILMMGAALSGPLFPMISELSAKEDGERLKSASYFITKFSLLALIPVALIFLAFPEIIIRVLFSAKYLAATTTLRILTLTMIVSVLFSTYGRILLGVGRNRLYTKFMWTATGLNIIGDLLLVPLFGIEGAATAFLVSFSIALLLEVHSSQKIIKFDFPSLSLVKMFLGGFLVLAEIFVIKNIINLLFWIEIPLILAPAAFTYLVWVLRTNVLEKKDLRMIKENMPIPKVIFKFLRKLS